MMHRNIIVTLGLWAAFSFAAPLPKTVNLAGQNLILNGVGMREATVFAVDVYEAGLYLKKKSQDGKAILKSKTPKQIRMRFVRNVGKEDLQEAWKEGFEKNCTGDHCKNLTEHVTTLQNAMSDIKEGDLMVFSFLNDRLEVQIRSEKKTTIKAKDFSPAILSLWIGDHPPNKGLKTGMLGQSS